MATISDVNAVTQQFYAPSVVENVFTSNPFFFKTWGGRKLYTGGTDVVQAVALTAPTSVGSYQGAQEFRQDTSTHLYGAELPWASYYGTITIIGLSAMKNTGPNAICNFVEVNCKLTELALQSLIGTDLFGTGASSATSLFPLVGLQAMYGNATTAATYANISRSTFSAWEGNVSSNGAVGRALTLPLINAEFALAMIDNEKPDMFLLPNAGIAKLNNLLQPQQRHIQTDELRKSRSSYDIGFENLSYEGKPFVADQHCPSTFMFAPNTRWVDIWVQSERAFTFQDFLRSQNADTALAQILVSMCPMNTQPRLGAVWSDMDFSL